MIKHYTVKVRAGAKKQDIFQVGDLIKVKLTKRPERGKANDALLSLLAEYFALPRSRITILRGELRPIKTIAVDL